MPHPDTTQDVGSILSKFGGTEVPGTQLPTGSIEEVMVEFGATPVTKTPAPDTTEDIFKKFGGTRVPPPKAPAPEPSEPESQGQKQEDDPLGLQASRAALIKERDFILNKVPEDDPRRKRMETQFKNNAVQQMRLERIDELGTRITLDGKPIKDDPTFRAAIPGLNKLEEIFIRFSGNVESTARRIFGDEEGALAVTSVVNDLQEYRQLLAQDSIFGEKYGPLFDSISTSLGVSTLNAASGGIAGVSGMFALEEFNQGMKDGEKLDPVEQWQTSAMRSGIMFATTLGGGLIAQRAGVSSGDSIVPFFGKAATELFTKTGAKNLAVAGGIEAGEEGLQSLLNLIEQANSGTNLAATENLLDKVLLNASVGGFVGSVTQATSRMGTYDLPIQHYRDLLDGWGKRMKGSPDSGVKVKDPEVASHGEDSQGRPVSRDIVNQELEALAQLDQEIEAQFDEGGATELKQLLSEREADIAGTKAEIAGLDIQIGRFQNVGPQSPRQATLRNFRNRRAVLDTYRKELESRQANTIK